MEATGAKKDEMNPAQDKQPPVFGRRIQTSRDTQDLMGKPAIPQKSDVRLGREVQARIGQQLRALYDDVVNQGVAAAYFRSGFANQRTRLMSEPRAHTHEAGSCRYVTKCSPPCRACAAFRHFAVRQISTVQTIWFRKRFAPRIAHIDSFEPGTNMPAWLFTILRNLFRSEYRKRRREVGGRRRTLCRDPQVAPRTDRPVEFEEFRTALAKLPSDQREALILVGASGLLLRRPRRPICGCAVAPSRAGSIRARTRLADLLAIDSVDDFRPGSGHARRPRRRRAHLNRHSGPRCRREPGIP